MISRRTIFSFLLTLLLALGLWAWASGRRDDCSAYLEGDTKAPADVIVMSGTRQVVVPCRYWFPRQPRVVQALCLLAGAGCVVFTLSLWGDGKKRG